MLKIIILEKAKEGNQKNVNRRQGEILASVFGFVWLKESLCPKGENYYKWSKQCITFAGSRVRIKFDKKENSKK